MKRIKIVCAVFLSFVILGSVYVYGENIVKNIQVTYRNISIQVNGKIVPSEQEPFIYQGHTFAPLRTIGEAVNKKVEWDNTKNQVIITDKPTATDQNFLSFPLHKIGERVEMFPFAFTIKKVFRYKSNSSGDENDSLHVDVLIENIADYSIEMVNYFSPFTLWNQKGSKTNDLIKRNMAMHLSPHEKSREDAYLWCRFDETLQNKPLILVFYPQGNEHIDYNTAPNFRVFLAFDLGKIE